VVNVAQKERDKSNPIATIGFVSDPNPEPIPLKQIATAGFRWPEFSPGFRKRWHTEIRILLRGHSGGKVFKVVDYPDGFRSDVHFWSEMRIWAAMAKTYADLGGDSVKDLAKTLLSALTDDSGDKRFPTPCGMRRTRLRCWSWPSLAWRTCVHEPGPNHRNGPKSI